MRDNACARHLYATHKPRPDGHVREVERTGEEYMNVQLSGEIGTLLASALIVARSAPFRESLAILVKAVPQIGHIEQVPDLASALTLNAKPPDLILCDLSVQDEAVETLRRVKARWPHVRCAILIKDETAYQQAAAIGADAVLTKGILAARLLETIEGLLSAQGG